ncbi:sensor histidine kinase [Brevibacillus brevis]|uniref:sensor histidine kinase n=1 Tax=Brevibacillus brevis TaxID=1393 RepID=UPI0025A661C1|nr:ATP-binding protein [Brevibacillus brevis]WJQ83323.1 ATP-binding protein [Brevibacillus brevis]
MTSTQPKNPRVLIIMLVSSILVLIFTCVSIAISYFNTIQSVRLSIANQSMKAASTVADSLDVDAYQEFLRNPVKENPAYKRIEQQLNQAREQFGLLYLYTIQISEDRQSGRAMIVARPPNAKQTFDIGMPIVLSSEHIQMIYEGSSAYYSDIIRDPNYGVYLSAGAPLRDKEGRIIGIIGVDTDVAIVEDIGDDVVRSSIPVFAIQGLFVVVLIFLVLCMERWYQRAIKAAVDETEETYQDELRSVICSMRSIRHDFVNHMQVLYGLIECGYYPKARDYVQSLLKETKLLDLTVRFANPALMVLLHTKWEQAKSKQIVMQFEECADPIDSIPSIDLIKILSNLIDNAIEAADLTDGEKRVSISFCCDEEHVIFRVENTGPEITPEQRARIFENGYTTKTKTEKKCGSRGTGLTIVDAVVHKYKGKIEVWSERGITRFTVWLPVK